MEEADIEYFKSMSKDTGIPYKTLISMYLTDCRNRPRVTISVTILEKRYHFRYPPEPRPHALPRTRHRA